MKKICFKNIGNYSESILKPYYDYLKGFVLKYENINKDLGIKYIPANSLNQLLDSLIYYKQKYSTQNFVPYYTNNVEYLKTLIINNKLGVLPDHSSFFDKIFETKFNNLIL